eukprot:51673-Eustigmatos_ZCMA.PRE.1
MPTLSMALTLWKAPSAKSTTSSATTKSARASLEGSAAVSTSVAGHLRGGLSPPPFPYTLTAMTTTVAQHTPSSASQRTPNAQATPERQNLLGMSREQMAAFF